MPDAQSGIDPMLMNELLPQFQTFFEERMLSQGFDFILPLETKGMLILNELDARASAPSSRVVFRRAFDFMTTEELQSKRVAVVDDTLFTGRSLNHVGARLKKLGVGTVEKYAFLVIEDATIAKYRRATDISPCAVLQRSDFEFILDDMSALSMRHRPVNPDHLLFSFHPATPVTAERLLEGLARFGLLVEYQRDPRSTICSLHYPSYSPKSYAASGSIDKTRVEIKNRGELIRFCPELFPRLSEDALSAASPDSADSIWCALHEAMTLPHQDDHARALNLYESFTIAARVRQAVGFVAALRELGVEVPELAVESTQAKRYYGTAVASALMAIVESRMAALTAPSIEPSEDADDTTASLWRDFPNTFTLTEKLLGALRDAYAAHNAGQADPYEWDSAALSIGELSERTGYSRQVVSVGVEHLNDYGYATPMTRPEATHIERKYRSTEIGTARLSL